MKSFTFLSIGIAFIFLALTVAANLQSNCSCGERPVSSFGSGNISAAGEFPWRTFIFAGNYRQRDGNTCDGNIISPSWILTSAHCLRNLNHNDEISVYFNITTTEPMESSWINADRHVIHPDYNAKKGTNDVALVHLKRRLHFGENVSPVCLPWNYSTEFLSGKQATATNWISDKLNKGNEEVLTNQQCKKYYGKKVGDDTVCTLSFPGAKKCNSQKSSSSLDYISEETGRSFLMGIFSHCGVGCEESSLPVVYNDVGKYLDWILAETKIEYCERKVNEVSESTCFKIDMNNTNSRVQSVVDVILSLTPDQTDTVEFADGLNKEINSDTDFSQTWYQAENIYNDLLSQGKFQGQEDLAMYNIALLCYTLDGFYWKFNKATYTLTNTTAAQSFPYPYYMKTLVEAIEKAKGSPANFTKDTTLYRGISGRVIAEEGQLLSFQQIVSSSRSRDVADKYAAQTKGCQTLFIITGPIAERLGLDNHSVGTAKQNLEVLLPPEQVYRITKIQQNGVQEIIYLNAV